MEDLTKFYRHSRYQDINWSFVFSNSAEFLSKKTMKVGLFINLKGPPSGRKISLTGVQFKACASKELRSKILLDQEKSLEKG